MIETTTSSVLAARLGITRRTLARWLKSQKELRPCRLARGIWSVPRLEAAGYLRQVPQGGASCA